MSRYIDADLLLAKCRRNRMFEKTLEDTRMVYVERSVIDSIPTADVVEVRHGEWKQNPFFEPLYYCSECGRHIEDRSNDKNPSKNFPYCHCGAKMDGERKEENEG